MCFTEAEREHREDALIIIIIIIIIFIIIFMSQAHSGLLLNEVRQIREYSQVMLLFLMCFTSRYDLLLL